MSHRKTKKKATKILKEVFRKYKGREESHNIFTPDGVKELKFLLYEFVKFMTYKEIKEDLKDYWLYI